MKKLLVDGRVRFFLNSMSCEALKHEGALADKK